MIRYCRSLTCKDKSFCIHHRLVEQDGFFGKTLIDVCINPKNNSCGFLALTDKNVEFLFRVGCATFETKK